MKILALETSCDDTSAAVVEDGRRLLANVVSSQEATHRRFGGVVPELASRRHLENLVPVLREALRRAGLQADQLDAVAVTHGPGLVGALLVGVSAGKALAYGLGLPLVAVHHLVGHIYANFLAHPDLSPPLLCLVVSGGHTSLLLLEDHLRLRVLGATRDDAAGEAFDKVARVLGLGYPGGPAVERLASLGDARAVSFPRAWLEEDSLDFSFSGLKSAVINYLHNCRQRGEEPAPAEVAAGFQAALVEVLAVKTARAAALTGVRKVALAGGVAANGALRRAVEERLGGATRLYYPPPELCTDNAAMVACAGYYLLRAGKVAGWDLNAVPDLSLS